MVFYTRLLSVLYALKKAALIIPIIFIFYFYIHRSLPDYYKHFNRSTTPLILLFTYNRSIKTRDNICKGTRNGGHIINFDKCPLKCEFSCRIEDFTQRSPQAVLFFGEDFAWSFKLSNKNRSSFDQRWIFWSWEAPVHHSEYTRSGLTFNWTMTYRKDSDIIHDYGRYLPRNLSYTIRDYQTLDFYLSSKDNQSTFHIEKEFQNRQNEILWFVSNCKSRTKRDKIADELNKYFSIKQYGQCSQSQKDRRRMSSKEFEQTLFRYKFYLAFENAHCQDYITEKTFYNALAHGSIPIVLGSTIENYEKLLPPNSFIHINHFNNMTQLANELDHISKNLTLFTFYHQWRKNYRLIAWPSNYYIDDLFCNLCIKLHNDKKQKSYENFSKWLNKCK